MQRPLGILSYSGKRMAVFRLAFVTGLLSLVTLGFYRFWAKTRIRQYIWSSTQVDGDAFEYTGTGLEKFLGFLVSVVVLAIYLAVVQVILFAVGLRFVFDPRTPAEIVAQLTLVYSTFFLLLPLFFFAAYRARRYRMARTRFRGIRFGMLNAAGGYTWRAVLLVLATVFSVGLLAPLMRFRLEKYMTDRTLYGDAAMAQGGTWTGLYGTMKHIFIALAIFVVGGIAATAQLQAPGIVLLAVGYVWLVVGIVVYRVQGFAYLTNHKTLGQGVRFECAPQTGTVIWRYIVGGFQIGLIVAVAGGILTAIGAAIMAPMLQGTGDALAGGRPPIGLVVVFALAYLVLLVFIAALGLALITQPILAYMIETVQVVNIEALSLVRQRATDKGADAEGLADALDIGGAF